MAYQCQSCDHIAPNLHAARRHHKEAATYTDRHALHLTPPMPPRAYTPTPTLNPTPRIPATA